MFSQNSPYGHMPSLHFLFYFFYLRIPKPCLNPLIQSLGIHIKTTPQLHTKQNKDFLTSLKWKVSPVRGCSYSTIKNTLHYINVGVNWALPFTHTIIYILLFFLKCLPPCSQFPEVMERLWVEWDLEVFSNQCIVHLHCSCWGCTFISFDKSLCLPHAFP